MGCSRGAKRYIDRHRYPAGIALFGKKRWADTPDAKAKLAILHGALEGWKEAGYDVSELEDYLNSPNITPEGVEQRVQALLGSITSRMRREATRSYPPQCTKCLADLTSKDLKCPYCGKPVPGRKQVVPTVRCPECKSRVGQNDRRCPTCGHRLRPWSIFPRGKKPRPG